jgi:hypothetical protein
MNFRHLFRGEPIDLSICPVDARAQLLRDLLEHDSSSLSLLSPSHSVLLTKVQALSKRVTRSYDVSQGDSLEAENPLRWLPDREVVQVMPSALAKFVGKAMSFGSLDRLQGRLSIEESRAEKARSDL